MESGKSLSNSLFVGVSKSDNEKIHDSIQYSNTHPGLGKSGLPSSFKPNLVHAPTAQSHQMSKQNPRPIPMPNTRFRVFLISSADIKHDMQFRLLENAASPR